MAVVIKTKIGLIRGQVGDFIYRVRNGKLVQYSRPAKINFSRSDAAQLARKNFSQLVRFAGSINSFPALKHIWKHAKVPGTTNYQKIIKNNSAAVRSHGISVSNIITPPGIPLEVNSLEITDSKISFRVVIQSDKLKHFFSQQTAVYVILYFHQPVKQSLLLFRLNSIVKDIEAAKTTFSAELELTPDIITNLKKYKRVLVFIAAISQNIQDQKIYWTNTYAEEMEL